MVKNTIERLIARIRIAKGLALTFREIHDAIVKDKDCNESLFYLCYRAAEILDKE